MKTKTVALSEIKPCDKFYVSNSGAMRMVTVEYNEYTSEAIIWYRVWSEPKHDLKILVDTATETFWM